MRIINKLYKNLPLFLQDLIVTIKNNQAYHQKYGAIPLFYPLKGIVKNIKLKINDDELIGRINYLIKEAIENTEYYSKRRTAYPFIQSLEELKKLPVLKKETLKKENKLFISQKANYFNSYNFKTSGSTGTPLYGKISLKDLRNKYKIVLYSQKLQGIDYSKRVARFPGGKVADERRVYRKDIINNHLLFSIYNISENNIKKYYYAFKKHKTQIIEGYPSTIYSLVMLLKIKELKIETIKHVITTAEQLLDFQKKEIEEYFNCKIFDFYSSSEGSTYMYLDESLNCYINSNKVGFVEVVDENYEPLKKGTLGRMLITSFSSSFTPLIRYDIGDYCSLSNDNYFPHPLLITEIGGRKEDIFITKEGMLFTRFSLCLKYLPNYIVESQLVLRQKSKNVCLEYMSTEIDFRKNDFIPFEEKFMSMLGEGYIFKYNKVDRFDKTTRGKLRAVKIINDEKS